MANPEVSPDRADEGRLIIWWGHIPTSQDVADLRCCVKFLSNRREEDDSKYSLFVINHGIAFGAGLYEQRILPQWFIRSSEFGVRVNSEAMRSSDTGRRFWAYITTVPLTLFTLKSGSCVAIPRSKA
jgi:hypothetical protein